MPNPERERAAIQRWRARNPDKVRAMHRAYGARHAAQRSAAALFRKYGLSMEDRSALAERQGGTCAVPSCEATELVVDHDHETGVVRGLLCRSHNGALGRLGDNVEALRWWITYLEGRNAD